MVLKYLREHEKTTSIVITLVGTFIISIVAFLFYQWFSGVLDSSDISSGEKLIVILLVIIAIFQILTIFIIYIELKETRSEILKEKKNKK